MAQIVINMEDYVISTRDIVLHKNSNPNLFYIPWSSLSQFEETFFFQPKHFKVDFSRTTVSSLFLAKAKVIHLLMLETL